MGGAISQMAQSGGSSGVGQALMNSSPILKALQNVGQGVGVAAQTPQLPQVGSGGVGMPGPTGQAPADQSVGTNSGQSAQVGSGTPADVQAYIAQRAPSYGVDPATALKVFNGEAAQVFDANKPDRGGDGGSSFGPTQLHYGGMNASMSHPGLGDEFTKQTGLDARDPSTWKQQVDFSLNYAGQHGWSPWMAAKNNGVGPMQGINGYPQDGAQQYQTALASSPKPTGATSGIQGIDTSNLNGSQQGLIGEMNQKSAAAQQQVASAAQPQTAQDKILGGLFGSGSGGGGRGRGIPQLPQTPQQQARPSEDTGQQQIQQATQEALQKVAQSTMTPTTKKQATIKQPKAQV